MKKTILILLLWWSTTAALQAQSAQAVQSAESVQSASDSAFHANASSREALADTGTASFYSSRFQGRATASGELYDENKMTAAHNRFKFGTRIRVTNLRNGKSVIVRVNDRMHSRNTRLVDLSRAAADKLGFIKRGLTRVRVEQLPPIPSKGRK